MATIIHIGYHRTGTTFLQQSIFPQCQHHVFHGHPQMREYGLVDVAWRAERSIDYPALQEVYQQQDYCISYESFVGPMLSGSVLIDTIPQRFKKVFGEQEVKILITTRRQDEFLKSFYAQWVASGGTNRLAKFLDQTVLDKPHLDLDAFDYWETYQSYKAVFGAENVLVLPYELMKKEEGKFLELLSAFCGEEFRAVERSKVAVNRSLSGYQIGWMRFLNKVFETQMSPDYLISGRFFNTMRYRMKLQRSNFLRFGKTFTDEEEALLQDILQRFASSNAALDELYPPYQLKNYGYY